MKANRGQLILLFSIAILHWIFRGTPAQIDEEKKRKAAEMAIFTQAAERMEKKDKETFLKVWMLLSDVPVIGVLRNI